MAFKTLLRKSVILTSVTHLLRDIVGIGSIPQFILFVAIFVVNNPGCILFIKSYCEFPLSSPG